MRVILVRHKRLSIPLAVVVITALVYGSYMFLYFQHHVRNVTYLANAGGLYCDASQVPRNLYIHPMVKGYDGQFYYRLAIDPFKHQETESGITFKFDSGAYRQQRIVYPLLAYFVSLRNPLRVGWALLIINLAGLCGIAYLGTLYARRKGQSPWWGLLLSLEAAAFTTVALDTTEITAMLFVVVSLLYYDRGKFVWYALWSTIAVLTRETSLFVSFMVLIAPLAQRVLRYIGTSFPFKAASTTDDVDRGTTVEPPFSPYFWAPFVVYLLWQAYLDFTWKHSPWQDSVGRLGFPFAGIADALQQGTLFELANDPHPLLTTHVIYLILFGVLVIRALRGSNTASLAVILSWVFFAVCGYSYRYHPVYDLDWSYLRVLTEFFALGTLILIGSRSRAKSVALAATVFVDLFFAQQMILWR